MREGFVLSQDFTIFANKLISKSYQLMKRLIAILAVLAALQGICSAQQKGFQGYATIGYNTSLTFGDISSDKINLESFGFIGGYRFLPNHFLGAGVEVQTPTQLKSFLFNIFLDYKVNRKTQGAWTSFFGLRAGCLPGGEDLGFSGGAFYGMNYAVKGNTGIMAMIGIQAIHKEQATVVGPAIQLGFSL